MNATRWRWWFLAAAVVMLIAVVTALVVTQPRPNTAAPPTATAPPTTVLTTTAASATTTTTAPGAGYQLLWPFADENQAAAWQASYRAGGHQPWHLDAGMTAQSFTQGYLGYHTLDQVTSVTQIGADAHVGVGYKPAGGQPATAAVLHLIKIGSGTDDTPQLTLTTPAYGATVTSPATVGGRITGVDENLRIQVFRLGDDKAVGQTGGIPAGGQNPAWTAQVSFTAPTGSTLTIAVSTGGHVNDVERFAITGARSGPTT